MTDDLEAGGGGHRRQRLGDMHGADDQQARRRHVGAREQPRCRCRPGVALRTGWQRPSPRPPAPAQGQLAAAAGGIDHALRAVGQARNDDQASRCCLRRGNAPSARPSFHRLDEDLHAAAAGQPDLPGLLVADAEFQQLRAAGGHHLRRGVDHRALDAAAGHRADEMPVASTARWLPSGRGEEPQVLTTVASAAACRRRARRRVQIESSSLCICIIHVGVRACRLSPLLPAILGMRKLVAHLPRKNPPEGIDMNAILCIQCTVS
jgi:hypothetical protein